MKKFYFVLALLVASICSIAQTGNIAGSVLADGEPSIGSVIRVSNTSLGTITDVDGNFLISDVPAGPQTVTISSVGIQDETVNVTVVSGETVTIAPVNLEGSLALEGVEVIADIAIDRKTPVAVSNIEGEYLEQRLGNQEIGEVLTVTPSVYATKQGGGAGDSRIVVRGFDQRNTVYMINGVPVNDMENGWVYWSNWAGLGDVARTIQVQRGLGASMLANPSVGGTVNLITKTTDMNKGGNAYATIGNDLYRKYGLTLSTGNINDWAITFSGSRTTGNGYVGGTFNDAYSWFGSISKDFNKHSLVLTGLGAPQRHGQRTFAYGLTSYVPNGDTDYATYIKGEKAGDHNSRDQRESIRWNSSYGPSNLAPILGSRENDYINERTNFYHKPQVNLNHYWDVNDNIFVGTTIYGSWGRGGGTGPYGSIATYKSAYRTGDSKDLIDWSKVQAANSQWGNTPAQFGGDDFYFLRASMNEHDWYGGLTKGIFSVSDNVDITAGVDYRTYTGKHYRKPVELFGLNGFNETGFADYPGGKIVTADSKVFGTDNEENKIAYDNDGKVNWLGGFSEVEYSTDKLTLTAAGSVSNKAYQRIDRRNYAANDSRRTSDKYDFLGYTAKAGASYNVNDNHNFFANAGYLSVAPVFDVIYPNFNNVDVNPDANNEKTLGLEAGYKFRTQTFGLNLNGYYTNWTDKTYRNSYRNASRERRIAYLTDTEALHKGIELDANFEPIEELGFTLMAAVNDWKWQNTPEVNIYDEDNNLLETTQAYIDGVKVGNAPQTQFALGVNGKPAKAIGLDATYRYFADYYSEFSPIGRTNKDNEGIQAVKLPNYGLLDLGANVNLPLADNNELYIRANLFNALDELYVSDAQDSVGGTLADLSGYFGQGRTWTTTMGVKFGDAGRKQAKAVNIPEPVAVEPVVLDKDNDGVLDAADKCPETPGTVNGCPDTDGDGVIDSKDECPETAGTNNGCPVKVETPEPEVITETVTETVEVEVIPDADGDGVIDSKDNCPNVAGSLYNAGCPKPVVTAPAPVVAPTPVVTPAPVVQQPTVEVVEQLNFIARSILFNTNSDVIKTESRVKLDEIASIMNQYPSAYFVIEGHTDNTGDAAYNKTLSQRRATSVKNYLTGKGISSSRLSAIGYGEEMPIADNNSAEGRQLNRRVVIKLQ